MNNQAKILSRSFFCRHRFALISMETRFGACEWFINDAEITAADGLPETVYQGDYKGAMAFIAKEQENLFTADYVAEGLGENLDFCPSDNS